MLIADSDPEVRKQLFSALLAVDVYSDIVGSVPDAVQKLGNEIYGVVLVDIALPGGLPEEVLACIAKMPAQLRPIVMVVAANPASARSLDVELVQIVLPRPLKLRQTVDVIRSCVANVAGGPDANEGEDADGEDDDGDHHGNGDQLTS